MVRKSILEKRPDLSVYLHDQRMNHPDLRQVANDEAALVYAMIRGLGISAKWGSKELAKELGMKYSTMSRLYYEAYRAIDRMEWVVPANEVFDTERYERRKRADELHFESQVLEKLL